MCGEHEKILLYGDAIPGSSPHVRGALWFSEFFVYSDGIIPACAGSTSFLTNRRVLRWDHPRMCGEHLRLTRGRSSNRGSSPHVRGAQHCLRSIQPVSGIIPACAGSTCLPLVAARVWRDHPRMCGEHRNVMTPLRSHWGSSPHVRGARGDDTPDTPCCGIIPACAGSTEARFLCSNARRDHPRMCGEHLCACHVVTS